MGSEPSFRFSVRAEGTLNQEALKQSNINNMRVIFVHSASAQSGSGYSETKVEKFETPVWDNVLRHNTSILLSPCC